MTTGVIPPDWRGVRRPADGELVGYLVPEGDQVVPITLFGHPLAEPADEASGRRVLVARGLAALAEPWLFIRDDGSEVEVRIQEAYPDHVELVRADFGIVAPGAQRFTLPVPAAGRLRPRPR